MTDTAKLSFTRLLITVPLMTCLLLACSSTPPPAPAAPSEDEQIALYVSSVEPDSLTIDPSYSVEPLQNAVFDNNTVLFESVTFHAWMDRYHRQLAGASSEQRQAKREQLYALIDSRAKYIYQNEGAWVLPPSDPVLSMLFYWVDALGAHGGELLVNALEPTEFAEPTTHTATQLPGYLDLSLEGGLFRLKSRDDWTLRFPYSFMLWQVGATADPLGQPIEVVTLSTGSAADKSALGHSQATVFIAHYRSGFDPAIADWLARYDTSDGTPLNPKTAHKYKSVHSFDAASGLHKEVVTLPLSAGHLVLLYAGLDGPYQQNRPHFEDVLRNVQY
ncbi:MAG: hypothetical protein AAF499_15560 [Pseudomonadota bacterium]